MVSLPASGDVASPSTGSDRREWYRTEYLQSEHWRTTRLAALERAEHRCQVCNRDKQLDVHHRTYERLGCERPADLTVLCRKCHDLFHSGGRPVARQRPRKQPAPPFVGDRNDPALRGLPDRRTNWSKMTASEKERLTQCLLYLLFADGPAATKALAAALSLRTGPVGTCLASARRRGLVSRHDQREWSLTAKGAAM